LEQVSGLILSDEVDAQEFNLCLLVPEPEVAPLIGKGGEVINIFKASSGANLSFLKKETSVDGYRRLFLSGTLGDVMRATFVVIARMQFNEQQQHGNSQVQCNILVLDNAAGAIIGKQGANLTKLRDEAGVNVGIAKREESNPALGGRRLSIAHADSLIAVARAAYSILRLPGFGSPTSKNPPMLPGLGGFGEGFCSIHGKKRGPNNLARNQLGQMVCMPEDPCKGASAQPNPAMLAFMGGLDVDNPQYLMALANFGPYGEQGYGPVSGSHGAHRFSPYGSPEGVCATHGKRRGPRNLVPNGLGQMVCQQHDECKGSGGVNGGLGGMPGFGGGRPGGPGVCSTHGKKRGTRNLVPHPINPGLFVCREGDSCK
jgi:transcription antitermination factor NusA-like protein